MSVPPIAIQSTGLVTAVGLNAPSSCAAFRAKTTNPTETRFIDSNGEWIMAHQVQLDQPWRGLTKLVKMAAMAIAETLQDFPTKEWSSLPLLLCVAEMERPGRMMGLDDQLLAMIQKELGVTFAQRSVVVPQGHVSVAAALVLARGLIAESNASRVLVAATDSLLSWPTLSYYGSEGRLLTASNSDGFLPGEGAGAVLVGPPQSEAGELVCTGIGFGRESAHINSGDPLRGDGLAQAFKASLKEAGCQMHDMDFRDTDISGEQFYFKEATLALARELRQRKEEFDIWHPAECTGEIGAVSGITVLTEALAASRKGYAKGKNVLAHWANDAGLRAALVLRYQGAL